MELESSNAGNPVTDIENPLDPYDIALKVLQGFGNEITGNIENFTRLRREVSSSYQLYFAALGKDYSQAEYQFAYLFLYFPCHSTFLNQPKVFSDHMSDLISKEELHVCSIGGGPGTDFFGLALLAEKYGKKFPKLHGSILELHTGWQAMFGAIRQACPSLQKYVRDVNFLQYDFQRELTDEIIEELQKADLVTMVKFLSEVSAGNVDIEFFQRQLEAICKNMKAGSRLLVIDNSRFDFQPLDDGTRDYLQHLDQVFTTYSRVDSQYDASVARINDKFEGFKTKTTVNILTRIWIRKQDE